MHSNQFLVELDRSIPGRQPQNCGSFFAISRANELGDILSEGRRCGLGGSEYSVGGDFRHGNGVFVGATQICRVESI